MTAPAHPGQHGTRDIPFVVDAKLLRELGARLVGRPHIALGELIKNSYDADATFVRIDMSPDRITVSDDGHGMSREEFVDRWMRIGTAAKEDEAVSRTLHRPLTGSKGVGRLSVQLLADHLQLTSRPLRRTAAPVHAEVDWTTAIKAGLLTRATARISSAEEDTRLPDGSAHGTTITLTGLQQKWDSRALTDLAREIWPLQPPFGIEHSEDANSFRVELRTGDIEQDRQFVEQMTAMLGLWTTRLRARTQPPGSQVPAGVYTVAQPREVGAPGTADVAGEDVSRQFLEPPPTDLAGETRVVELALETSGGRHEKVHYKLDNCALDRVRFEIRVFNLRNRQPHGISVREARAYLNRFGGVHVYDAGFHLPYYGPETDWLRVEFDHSHRLSQSALLPRDLVDAGGSATAPLQYLPTNSRLFGTVHVDTSREQAAARRRGKVATREALSIQVTRDRLADTEAYRDLVKIVRFAIDLYAIREAQEAWRSRLDRTTPKDQGEQTPQQPRDQSTSRTLSMVADRADVVSELLNSAGDDLPQATRQALSSDVAEIASAVRREAESAQARLGLLGALATAGISTLAYEHEASRQNALLRGLVQRLRRADPGTEDVRDVADAIDDVLDRAAATRRLFSHLLDERSRTARGDFLAGEVTRTVTEQVRSVLRGVTFDTSGIPPTLRLPAGGYAEWVAVLQNVLINAYNAMLDEAERTVRVDGGAGWLRVQDTGSGVDLAASEQLFAPFERRSEISEDRRNLGLGGTGLGLTIVRMLATDVGAHVGFENPDPGFATSFVLRWSPR